MRYVQVPQDVTPVNPITLEPWMVKNKDGTEVQDKPVSFAQACRIAVAHAMAKDDKIASTTLLDLLDKVRDARAGSWVAFTESEHALLMDAFQTPKAWQPMYILNAGSHVRAILDARAQMPIVLAPPPEPPVLQGEVVLDHADKN